MDCKVLQIQQKKSRRKLQLKIKVETIAVGDFIKLKVNIAVFNSIKSMLIFDYPLTASALTLILGSMK